MLTDDDQQQHLFSIHSLAYVNTNGSTRLTFRNSERVHDRTVLGRMDVTTTFQALGVGLLAIATRCCIVLRCSSGQADDG
jgi:hypothetical protein